MANADPILLLSYKRHTWIWDFSLPILYVPSSLCQKTETAPLIRGGIAIGRPKSETVNPSRGNDSATLLLLE